MNNITLLCTLRVIEPDSLCRVISMYYSEKNKVDDRFIKIKSEMFNLFRDFNESYN